MANPPRSRNAIRRASFGRAERLKREAGDSPRSAKAAPSRKQPGGGRPAPAPKLENTRAVPARSVSARSAFNRDTPRQAGHQRKPTSPDAARTRAERVRETSERQRQQRIKDQTRTAFNREAERRRDTTRRVEQERKRQNLQATLKRAEDSRRRQAQRLADRRREDMRRSFNREAENRKATADAARQKELQRRATADIERDQKRRAADQQTEHRRQTSEVRQRHQGETRSFRSNENTVLERHHHAIKRLDEAEARALHAYDLKRGSLGNRVAERLTGRREDHDRKREDIQKGFEAERMAKHRDLEAVKERQFNAAQAARLKQAHERKEMFDAHRNDRAQLQDRQAADRPRLTEDRGRALLNADRERDRERELERKEPEREHVSTSTTVREFERPSMAFGRA